MRFGYARVSTKHQSMDLQYDALVKAGCQRIFRETITGSRKNRPELEKLLEILRPGDTLVVFKIDRLARSLNHLIELMNHFIANNISFISLSDPVDTTSSHGKFMFNIFASLAEFEREMITERSYAGLLSARARGRIGGRPKGLTEDAKKTAKVAEILYKDGEMTVTQICSQLNISKATLYKYLRFRNVPITSFEKAKKKETK